MKTLNDLGLCEKSRKKIEEWLQEWLDLFIKQANGKQGWAYRADFENDDFFFFTDCKDILRRNPEARAHENNLARRNRKRKVLMQLFVKTLLGRKNICDVIKCGHCGFSPCWIEGLKDGTGHWTYCPKCKKLEVQVFPEGYDTCINTIRQEIAKKKFNMNDYPVIGTPTALMKKRKIPKGAWSTIIKGDKEKKKCPNCKYLQMTSMTIYLDTSLTPADGWHCPKCFYREAKK